MLWSPDSRLLATLSNREVWLWSRRGTGMTRIGNEDKPVSDLAGRPRDALATASREPDVRLWNPSGEPLAALPTLAHASGYLAWNPAGRSLAFYGPHEGVVRVWDAGEGPMELPRGHLHPVTFLSWQPHGSVLATASSESRTSYHDAEGYLLESNPRLWGSDGKTLASPAEFAGAVGHLAWSPNGRVLVTGCYPGLVLRSPAGELHQCPEGHPGIRLEPRREGARDDPGLRHVGRTARCHGERADDDPAGK